MSASTPEIRALLLKSAFHFIYRIGWSQDDWETDTEVLALAREHGIEKELTHIASLAASGFCKR